MTYASKTREDQVASALARCSASVKQPGGGHWEFSLANGKVLGVSARLFEDWLVLDSALTDRIGRGGWWELLRLNAYFEGLSKFVLTPEAQAVHLRAELPLGDDDGSDSDYEAEGVLTTRLVETCAGLKEAYRCYPGETMGDHPTKVSPVDPEGPAKSRVDELRRLCVDAGWPFIERSAGRLMVDLDVRTGFYQASVEHRGEGAEVAVEIIRSQALGATSRQALSLLLLATGALVRLARPSIDANEERIAARFEVRFTTPPTAGELAHAFASLSVACGMSGREAQALQDERIARDYLAMMGAQASVPASSSRGD